MPFQNRSVASNPEALFRKPLEVRRPAGAGGCGRFWLKSRHGAHTNCFTRITGP